MVLSLLVKRCGISRLLEATTNEGLNLANFFVDSEAPQADAQ